MQLKFDSPWMCCNYWLNGSKCKRKQAQCYLPETAHHIFYKQRYEDSCSFWHNNAIDWSNLPIMNSLNHIALMGCLASARFIRNLFNEYTNMTQPGIQNAGNKLCLEYIFLISFQLYVNFNVFTKQNSKKIFCWKSKSWKNVKMSPLYNVHHY